MDKSSRTTALLEVTAMAVLLLSYIWGWQGAFKGGAQLVTGAYFGIGLLSHVRRGESWRELGLRLDNLRSALRHVWVVVAIGVCVPLAIGAALGTLHFRSWAESLESAPWMIAWGTAQQYGLLCFFYRRLLEVLGGPWAATAGAAAIFAGFHLPNPFLTAVTLAAGLVSCTLYRRAPNVFALGLAHATISFALFYALPYSVTHGLRVGPGYLALN